MGIVLLKLRIGELNSNGMYVFFFFLLELGFERVGVAGEFEREFAAGSLYLL